jgi:hypothetical protein
MSFAQFKDNLKNGKYESVTGARRGIGKFKDMTEDEKNAARKIADKHFGAEPAAAAAPKAAAKKVAKKAGKKAAPVAEPKAAAATAAGPGPGRGRKKKAASKPGPAAKRVATIEGVDPVVQAGVDAVNSADAQADILIRAVDKSTIAAQVFSNSNAIFERTAAAASARLLEIFGDVRTLKTDLNTAVANAASSGNGVSETTAPQVLQSAMPGMPSTLPGLPVR